MAGIVKHNMSAFFAALRADGWGPTTEGATSIRQLAAAHGIPAGTALPRVKQERAKAGGGLLAPPIAPPVASVVDPDADLPA